MITEVKTSLKTNRYSGQIAMTSRGAGYVAVAGFEEDIEIPAEGTVTALHGDTVEIALLPRRRGVREQGEVVRVITRARSTFVGAVDKTKDGCFVIPDHRKIHVDFLLKRGDVKKCTNGEKVLVRFLKWNDSAQNPIVEFVEKIGRAGEHNTEMRSIVLERGFDTRFPSDVEIEALRLKKQHSIEHEIPRRRDSRGVATFTIDPDDAKDFDDALSIKMLEDGTYEIGIHIADVSHYVRPDTKLDEEAAERGTSVYLVDRTVPMLPEILSNDLCSLNPNEDKLTYSAIFTIDKDANVLERWFGRTVTHSNKRFTYEEARDTLGAKKGGFLKELDVLNNLAKKLKAARHKEGAIEFEEAEVKFVLDRDGTPLKVLKKERLDTHKLVEEFMLLANREVAECIARLEKKSGVKRPFIYRIHDVPDPEKIAELAIFLKAIGHEVKIDRENGVSGNDLNALFKQLEGEAVEGLVKTAAIRAMAKAVYATKNIGHFGLAFQYYTHFTSPIRRYPDIMVHRLLDYYLAERTPPKEELDRYHQLAAQSTRREIDATDAERESVKYKQVEYMKDRVGEEFSGVISGVTEYGVYVEEIETKAEGMIRMRDLSDDFYELDRKTYSLVGQHTKKTYSLGDRIRVRLKGVELGKKTIDWAVVEK